MNIKVFQKKFADRVRKLRLEHGLRQEDLEDYDISWKTVQKIEYKKTVDVKLSTLLKFCEAFKITLAELLDVEDKD